MLGKAGLRLILLVEVVVVGVEMQSIRHGKVSYPSVGVL
jgi:hypothetical protein